MRALASSSILLLVFCAACIQSTSPTDPGSDGDGTTTGSLTVTATTTGTDVDADGYSVTVGSTSMSVAANGSVTFTGLPAGPASVSLTGVAPNCVAAEVSPLVVPVVAGQTTEQGFNVDCVALGEAMTLVAADRTGQIWIIDEATGQETMLNHEVLVDDGLGGLTLAGVVSSMVHVSSTDQWWMGMGGNSVCGRGDFCVLVMDLDGASPTFGQYVELGRSTPPDAAPGLAVQPGTGRIFTGSADAGGIVYEVDPATAATTPVSGIFFNSQGQGMTFGLDGLLYIASEDELFSYDVDADIDNTVATLTYAGFPTLVDPSPTIGSLATRSDGTVFGILKDGGGGGSTSTTYLVTVDLTTGVVTNVGANTNLLDGLAYIPTRLVQARQT